MRDNGMPRDNDLMYVTCTRASNAYTS
jgi:hypothetical protein